MANKRTADAAAASTPVEDTPVETTQAGQTPEASTETGSPAQQSTPPGDFVAVEPLLHDGDRYAPGESLPELTERQATDLLKAGVIIQGISKT